MNPPVLRAGWQTDQSANSKDLTFNFNPRSFQSNPRIGPTVTNGVIFSLPTNSRHSGLPTVAAPTPLNCNNYFSCFAGTTPNVILPATGAAVASTATSKVPCFPSASSQCDVTVSPAVGYAPAPATPPATLGSFESASTNTAKKYQYWSVKVKPYLET